MLFHSDNKENKNEKQNNKSLTKHLMRYFVQPDPFGSGATWNLEYIVCKNENKRWPSFWYFMYISFLLLLLSTCCEKPLVSWANLWDIQYSFTFILCSVIINTIEHIVRRMVNVIIIGAKKHFGSPPHLTAGVRYNVCWVLAFNWNQWPSKAAYLLFMLFIFVFSACNRFRMVQCFFFFIFRL